MDELTRAALRKVDRAGLVGAAVSVVVPIALFRFMDGWVFPPTHDSGVPLAIGFLVLGWLEYRAQRRALLAVGAADVKRLKARTKLEQKIGWLGACRWFVPFVTLVLAPWFTLIVRPRALGWSLSVVVAAAGVLATWTFGFAWRARAIRARSEFGG